jgi:predicted nuclease of predicted toxin-antitoxin system
MNLSPGWAASLKRHGHEAVHWSEVGDQRAPDAIVVRWARGRGYVVFTHDLDFDAALAATSPREGGRGVRIHSEGFMLKC